MIYDERFRNIELKIGILLLIVLAGTVFALVYVGYKKDLFANRITYLIISPTGERIVKGMPVKFEGFRMGEVTKLDLNEEGKIELTVKILKRYQKWIKTDSKVFFNQESLIGDPFLRFTGGSKDREVMPEDAVFILEFEGGIDEIIRRAKPVMEDLSQIVQNFRVLSDEMSSPRGDLRLLLGSLKETADALHEGDGMLPYLLHRREAVEKVEQILDDLNVLERNYDALAATLSGVVENLDATVGEIRGAVTLKLNPILDDIAKTTKDLYLLRREGEHTLRLGSDLLLKLNNTWPLAPSGEVKKTPELPRP